MAERIIERIDAKGAIKRNAENSFDWEYHDEAKVLYNLAVRFRDELIDPLERIDRTRMSDPVISFDDERNKEVLATYTVGRNALGLRDQINFNTAHYNVNEHGKKEWKYGRWSQLETLLHEQVHLYMHHLSDTDGKKRPAHGVEFVEKCLQLGLHVVPVLGAHYQVADADSPFGRIMKELGVPRPADVPRSDDDPLPKRHYWSPEKGKGKSTLHKYQCPGCGLKVRVGVSRDPMIAHPECGVFFVNADHGDIYRSK